MNEINVLKQLNHPNIIYLKEIIDPEISGLVHKIYLVTQYCQKGTLENAIKNKISAQ